VSRRDQELTHLELRFHSGLAYALRLAKGERCEFSFLELGRGMERVFGSPYGDRWPREFDPRESTFFSVCCAFRLVRWDAVDGDSADIPMSRDHANRLLVRVCTESPWADEGGLWSPEAFHQIVLAVQRSI
jgi:hypothetical protein